MLYLALSTTATQLACGRYQACHTNFLPPFFFRLGANFPDAGVSMASRCGESGVIAGQVKGAVFMQKNNEDL